MSDKIIREAMRKDGQTPGPNMQKFLAADKKADEAMAAVKRDIESATSGQKKK